MKNFTADNSNSSKNSSKNSSGELLPKFQQHAPAHPALSRMKEKLMQTSGVQSITAYDRMHHRHNRS